MIADSHCHLDYSNLYNQLDDVVMRAQYNQVKYMLTICTTLESFDKIKLIIKKYKNIYGTFGIHPHESKNYTKVDLKYILNLKKKYKKVIGIGETGLDFYYNHSDKKIQKKSFIEHIQAASQLNIPLIAHSRNAEIDTYEILREEKKNYNLKVLMHCFTGSKDFARKLIDINCYISVSGIITFKNSNELTDTISSIPIKNLLVETVSSIPINRLLIETDSPYLSPAPLRGKSNEPSHLIHIANKLALIKNLGIEEIEKETSKNFFNLFKII